MVDYWEIAAYSTYDMFSTYKYLIVNLVYLIANFVGQLTESVSPGF